MSTAGDAGEAEGEREPQGQADDCQHGVTLAHILVLHRLLPGVHNYFKFLPRGYFVGRPRLLHSTGIRISKGVTTADLVNGSGMALERLFARLLDAVPDSGARPGQDSL